MTFQQVKRQCKIIEFKNYFLIREFLAWEFLRKKITVTKG